MKKIVFLPLKKLFRISLIAILPATYFLKQGIDAQSIFTNLTFWVFCLAYFLCLTKITILSRTISLNSVDILLFIFAIYVFLSTLWSPFFNEGIRKAVEFALITLPIVYIIRFLIRDTTEIEQVIKVSIFVALILVVPYMIVFVSSGKSMNRVTLNIVQPVAMGLFCSIQSYSSLYFFIKGNKKLFYLFCFVVFSISLFLTGSRASIFALFFTIIWYLLKKNRTQKVYIKLLFILFILFFVVNVYVPFSEYIIDRFSIVFSSRDPASQSRMILWERSIDSMAESPLLGKGTGSEPWGYAHNIFLEIGSENGLFGISLLLVIISLFFRIKNKIKKERTYELIMGIFMICSFVSLFSFSYSFNRYLFFSIGFILVLYHIQRKNNVSTKSFNNNSIVQPR